MRHLMGAEWLKLTRRPLLWILLAVFLVLMMLAFLAEFFIVGIHRGIFGGVSIELLDDAQLIEYQRGLRFPGVFGSVLAHINTFGGICAIILAAGAFGSEYTWGTLRLQLSRQPDRGRYLLAKTLTLLLVLLAGMVVALAAGVVLALITGSLLGDVGSVSMRDVLVLPFGMLRALYVMLAYILFTIAVCIIGRSLLAGVAGGLLFLLIDGGAGSFALLGQVDNQFLLFFFNLLLQQNINTLAILNRSMYGFDPALMTGMNVAVLPSPWQATLVIGLYSALFFGYAYYAFKRYDIQGSS